MSDEVKVDVTWRGGLVEDRARVGCVSGLRLGSEHLLQVANETVPLEEGTLMRSGAAQVDEGELKGAVSYDTVYAVYQHERLENRHAPGRRAKWLELAYQEEIDTIHNLMATAIRRALE